MKKLLNLIILFSVCIPICPLRADDAISADNLEIQELEESDTAEVSRLFKDNPDISEQTGTDSFWLMGFCSSLSRKVYVCRDIAMKKIVAFVVAFQSGKSFYVRALGVDKDYRRFGIATKLLKKVYSFALDQKNYETLTIHASNLNARKCYEKFGFKNNSLTGYLTLYLLNQ